MKVYYVGQRPLYPLTIAVKDRKGSAVDLTEYDAVEVLFRDQFGRNIDDLKGGTVTVLPGGIVKFNWGTESIFDNCGQWKWILRLTKSGGVVDYPTRNEPFIVRNWYDV